jgi:hypothetical protein
MSVWVEILLFVFLVLIMERLIGIQHALARIGSRLEEAIEDRRTRDYKRTEPQPRNEWIEDSPDPPQCEICGRRDGGHSLACTRYREGS